MQDKKGIFRLVWAIFMLLIYFGMAFLLFFSDFFNFRKELCVIFACCFLICGLVRLYTIIKQKR
jgi:hypothetical protein